MTQADFDEALDILFLEWFRDHVMFVEPERSFFNLLNEADLEHKPTPQAEGNGGGQEPGRKAGPLYI